MNQVYPGTVTGINLTQANELLKVGLVNSLSEAFRLGRDKVGAMYDHAISCNIIR